MSFKLGQLLSDKGYIRGPFGSSLKRNELLEEGIPVYEQQNAIYDNRDFRYYIDNEKYQEMKRFTVKENDLIISCSGTVGRVSIIKNDDPIGIISQALLILRPNIETVFPKFLYYFFTSKEGYNSIISRSGGSVQANISKRAIIENIDIHLPPLPEQKAIANILSTLDEKIEVNNQINKTLENIAQTIFKQWFVDFEFPNGAKEPYKSSGGEMVESELGMIPKGWNIVKLNSIVDIRYGKNLPTTKLLSSGYPVFGGNGQIGFYSEYLYEKSQVLIACRGAASGKVIVSLPYSFITNNSLVLEIKDGFISHEYLLQFCLYNEFYKYSTGSAQPQITIANLANVYILLPEKTLMNKFSLIRKSFDSKILSLLDENKINIKLRDSLLPKLMSGEIRVPIEEN